MNNKYSIEFHRTKSRLTGEKMCGWTILDENHETVASGEDFNRTLANETACGMIRELIEGERYEVKV